MADKSPENQSTELTQINSEIAKAKADLAKFGDSPSEEVREEVKKIQERLANLEKQRETIINESRNERGGEYTLERIKKEIKEKGMSFELTKEILENIDKISAENKPFVLGGIFSGLNQIGIGINGINEKGEIVFNTPEKPFNQEGKIADYAETIKYKNLINNCISSGKISISDLTKALLYRTTSIDDYINEQVDKNFSTSKYVERLLEKYPGICFNEGITGVKTMIKTEGGFNALKELVKKNITDNQADKEFLLAYVDDLYYRKKSSLDEGEITTYNKISDNNQKKVLKELNNLNEEQRFALGVRDSNEATQVAKEATKDPVGFMKKSLNANNFTVALMTGLLGGILSALFGKGFGKGFLGGAILGFAGAAGGVDFLKGQLDKHGKKGEGESKEGEEKASEKKTNSLYGIISFSFENNPEKKQELQRIWGDLSKNEKFLGAPTTILSIFESTPAKTFEEIQTELKKYGIVLTNENKDYYKTIFAKILKQREAAGIGEPKEDENIETYLTRSSKDDENVVVAGVVGGIDKEGINENFKLSGYTENGRNYIIGQDGNPKLIEYSQLSPEFQKQIERLNTSGKVVNNFLMILTTLSKKEPKFNSYIAQLQEKIEKIDISKKDDIENLLKWIYESKDNINTSLNNGSDAQTHPWTLNIDLSKDEEVLQLIRKIDSESAKQHLIEKLFSLTSVSDDELNNFITNPSGDHTKIQSLLGNDAYIRFSIEISEKKSQAEIYLIENRENFKKQIKEKNKNISDTEVDKILDEQYKPMITGSFIHSFAKDTLLETFLAKNTEKNWLGEYNGDNELLKLYGDIVGVGWGNISDKSLDWGKEALLLIGTEIIAIGAGAITMGAGFYAINAAVWGVRGYRGINYLQKGARLANEGIKAYQLGRWGTMSVIEGSSFYLGYGGAQSMIEGENMYSKEGLMHSIAFAGAFRALRAIPGLQFKPDVALSEQKLKITSVLAADTAALGAIGLGFDGVLFEPGEWTAEHFIQAFAMAVMFRGMTHAGEKINLKFRRNGERVEVSSNTIYVNSSGEAMSGQYFNFLGKKESLIKSILPKKAGEEVIIGDKTITKTREGNYKFNGETYDKIDDILPVLSKEFTDAQIITKISEGGSKNLNKLFNGVVGKEIQIGDDIFRFRVEGGNKILEIRNGNGWATKSIDDLSDGEAQLLLDRILGTGVKDKIIGGVKSFQFTGDRLQNVKEGIGKMNDFIMKSKMDTSKGNPLLLKTIINDGVTHPLRAASQIIDTLANGTTKKTDLLKLLTLGNKGDIKDIIKNDWGRLAFTAGAAGNFVIWNEDWSTKDIGEFFLYNILGLTLGGLADMNIED